MSIASYHQEEIAHTVWLHIAWTCAWTVSTAKYLGLNLREQLSWNSHTDVTAKASKTRSFITRNVHSCPKKVKAAYYTTLVRPVMEYATAWAPHHTAQNCNKLEQVQRRAARFACHRYERTASVTAMLNNLKWETLETRSNNQRLTMFYRMQHNGVYFFSWLSCPSSVVTKQKIRSRPDVSSAVCLDRRLQILFLPGNCTYVECTTSIGDPVWDTLLLQSRRQWLLRPLSHITWPWATQCVIVDHRGLHFTGRWR